MIIDPYFGQNAVRRAWKSGSTAFIAVVPSPPLIAMPLRFHSEYCSGWHRNGPSFAQSLLLVVQAATAFGLSLLLPQLNDVTILAVMTVLLGLYWADWFPSLFVDTGPRDELALASFHQMFGVYCASKARGAL